MTLALLPTRGRGVLDLQTSEPPPVDPGDSWAQAANEVRSAIAVWPFDTSIGNGLGDSLGGDSLAIAEGGPIGGLPAIVEDDDGESMYFGASGAFDRVIAAHRADWNSNAITFIIHGALMRLDQKATLLVRESASLPGSIGIEVEPGGVARFFVIADDGSVVNLRSSAGTIALGVGFSLSLVISPALVTGYILTAGGTTQTLITPATVAAATFERAITFGAYYAGESPALGAIGRAVVSGATLSQAECESVMRPRNVTWARDVDLGAVTASANTDVDVLTLSAALYQGAPTIVVTGQPSGSTLSVVSGQVRIEAGASTGSASGTVTINGFEITLSFDVQAAATNQINGGAYIGLGGMGASAGNGTGVGRYSTSQYWVYRFTAPMTGTMDRFRWNLPKRPAYKGGTGGDMRVTIRADDGSGNPNLSAGGIVWQSSLFVMSQDGSGNMIYPAGVTAFFGFGTDEGAEIVTNAALTSGTVYHVVWTNENSNPSTNWYSINHAWNHSMPQDPYHQWPMWDQLATLAGNSSDAFGFAGNRFIPYFQFRRSSDAQWWGQNYFDCGTTSLISSGSSTSGNSREIGLNDQIRQRWTHTAPTMTVSRWRGRVWRRTSNTTYPLRIRLVEEGTGTLADVTVAASSIFQPSLGYDNLSGEVFAPIDVSLGGTFSLTNGETYQLELSTANDATRFAMRAPNGYSKSTLNIGWGGWLGRGEYSINGGSSWTGMHMYGTDNRSDCDWSMALHSTVP